LTSYKIVYDCRNVNARARMSHMTHQHPIIFFGRSFTLIRKVSLWEDLFSHLISPMLFCHEITILLFVCFLLSSYIYYGVRTLSPSVSKLISLLLHHPRLILMFSPTFKFIHFCFFLKTYILDNLLNFICFC
jgi:hypothetical protein